jgi:hypothetical protein
MDTPERSRRISKIGENRSFICSKITDIKTTDDNSVNFTYPTRMRCEYHGCSCVLLKRTQSVYI